MKYGYTRKVLRMVFCALFMMLSLGNKPAFAEEFAEEIVYTESIRAQLTDWVQRIAIPQFDPAIGQLTAVNATVSGGLEGSARFENLEQNPVVLEIGMEADIYLYDIHQQPFSIARPRKLITKSVPAFDQFLDFGGTSGGVITDLVAADISDATVITDGVELLNYIGTDEISLGLSGQGRSYLEGAGNLAGVFSLDALAAVTVTYTYVADSISLEKHTNGEDADTPTGPTIEVGAPVSWEYIVHNTSARQLVDVVVTDDQGEVVSCPKSVLAADEIMTCTASGTARTGQYSNVGSVTGQPVTHSGVPVGEPVADSDRSHYIGSVVPGIVGDYVWHDRNQDGLQDADEPPMADVTLQLIDAQGDVIATDLTDEQGLYRFENVIPGSYTVSVLPSSLPAGSVPTFDADGLGSLHSSAVIVESNGEHLDIDFGYGFAQIDIETHTNGEDADTPTGPAVRLDAEVNWEYIVTNRGTVTLTNITVTDDQDVAVTCPQGTLSPGDGMICTASGVGVLGQYANVGSVTGQPLTPTDIPVGELVSDTDPSHYFGTDNLCPFDPLPDVEFLGGIERGNQTETFVLPEGYETFIIKHPYPFRFEQTVGELGEDGQRTITLDRRNQRAWACSGDCDFTQALEGSIEIGTLPVGSKVNALIIDDDPDERLVWWAADDPQTQTQLIDTEGMMTAVTEYTTPANATWHLTSQDSIGVVKVCIIEPQIQINAIGLELEAETEIMAEDDGAEADLLGTKVFLPLSIVE